VRSADLPNWGCLLTLVLTPALDEGVRAWTTGPPGTRVGTLRGRPVDRLNSTTDQKAGSAQARGFQAAVTGQPERQVKAQRRAPARATSARQGMVARGTHGQWRSAQEGRKFPGLSAPQPGTDVWTRPDVSRDLGVFDMRGITRGTKSRILMGNLACGAGGRVNKTAGREPMRRRSSSS
jgi:hypothetical protein